MESQRSSNPPCPGKICPESFTPETRLINDSIKSPIIPIALKVKLKIPTMARLAFSNTIAATTSPPSIPPIMPPTAPALVLPGLVMAAEQESSSAQDSSKKYFKIQVVDRQTGRGVPLVELRTTNNTPYFTDSNGIVAYYEPGLMDREVFFFVESHGYEFQKDGFGFHGTRLKTCSKPAPQR